jgi:hypothetical protein
VPTLNATSTAPIYSTCLGGSIGDEAHAIAVDGEGNAYITGGSCSTDFPTVNALRSTNRKPGSVGT